MRARDRTIVRRLSSLDVNGHHVVSLYMNLDPSQVPNPAARQTQVESLLDEVRRRLRDGELPDAKPKEIEADLDTLRAWLSDELSADGLGGIAVFVASGAGLFETVPLRGNVDSAVFVDRTPVVEPLVRAAAPDAWCVLLVNSRTARILRGDRDGLAERRTVTDDVPNRTDVGGWSQARYQRHVDDAAHAHVKHVAAELFQEFQRSPFDALVIGTLDQMRNDVEGELHPEVRGRLAGHADVDVEHSSIEDVFEAVRGLFDEWERRREAEALDRLREALGRGELAVTGLGDVLDAVYAQRVGTLVVQPGFSAPGVACPACGWIATSGDRCPADGSATEPREDVVEEAIEAAIRQSAEVLVLEHSAYDSPDGPIAALLRF